MRQYFTATLLERLLCGETKDIIPDGTSFEARLRHVFDCRHVCERDEIDIIDEDGPDEEEKRFTSIEGIGGHSGDIVFSDAEGRKIARGQICGLDLLKMAEDGEKCFVLRGTIKLEGRNNQFAVMQYRFGKCGFPEDCKDIKDALCDPENWKGTFKLLGVITKAPRGRRGTGPGKDGNKDSGPGNGNGRPDGPNNGDDSDESDDSDNG